MNDMAVLCGMQGDSGMTMENGLQKMTEIAFTNDYVADVKAIFLESRRCVRQYVNHAMVWAYWLTGKRIVLQEQNGERRAEYGKEIVKRLSIELTKELGRGFSVQSLYNFRMFYERFTEPEKFSTVWRVLTWSHYKMIMRVAQKEAREWYCNESSAQNWDARTLDRNISTQYYERLISSQIKDPVVNEMKEKTKEFQDRKLEFMKNPYVLEFLGLPENKSYVESDFERAIIGSLKKFLLELGKGFAFVERQKLVRTDADDFYIDLVFYNYILKCFVLIDLKNERLTHKDVGQMDFYVRLFDDLYKKSDDNPTIGLLLCSETDKAVAKYSVLNDSRQIFASKYLTLLPTEQELAEEIERQRNIFIESHAPPMFDTM